MWCRSLLFSNGDGQSDTVLVHHGRTLLSVQEQDLAMHADFLNSGVHNISNLMVLHKHLEDCPMYFNKTESLRYTLNLDFYYD